MMAASGWLIFEAEIEIQEFFGVYFQSFGEFEDGEDGNVLLPVFNTGNIAMVQLALCGQAAQTKPLGLP